MCVILGLNHDGAGYRVLQQTDDGVGKVSASVHVRPQLDMTTERSHLARARANPLTATEFQRRHYRLIGDPMLIDLGEQELRPFRTPDSTGVSVPAPIVQEVGASPGHGGSRVALLPKRQRLPPASGTPASIMTRPRDPSCNCRCTPRRPHNTCLGPRICQFWRVTGSVMRNIRKR